MLFSQAESEEETKTAEKDIMPKTDIFDKLDCQQQRPTMLMTIEKEADRLKEMQLNELLSLKA